jgi:hypothetical protein
MSAQQTALGKVQPAGPRRRNGTAKAKIEPVSPPGLATRIVTRASDGTGGPRARVLVTLQSGVEVDVTRTIVSAIAHALWESRGEDHIVNWLDAETVFNQAFAPRSAAASTPRPGRATPARKEPDDEPLPALLPRPMRSRRL